LIPGKVVVTVAGLGTRLLPMSKELADNIGAFIPLKEPYELRTADEKDKLKIIGYCRVEVVFQGVEVPGGAV